MRVLMMDVQCGLWRLYDELQSQASKVCEGSSKPRFANELLKQAAFLRISSTCFLINQINSSI